MQSTRRRSRRLFHETWHALSRIGFAGGLFAPLRETDTGCTDLNAAGNPYDTLVRFSVSHVCAAVGTNPDTLSVVAK